MKHPIYCKAKFPCRYQLITRHSHNNNTRRPRVKHTLLHPIKICYYTETCNQRTNNMKEAISEMKYVEG